MASPSLPVFTQCIQVALGPLQREGMMILLYLEDWLLCAKTPQQAASNTVLTGACHCVRTEGKPIQKSYLTLC